MSKSKKEQIAILSQRVETLERLLCPSGHKFIAERSEAYCGTGRGDELFQKIGFCNVCHKKMIIR